MQIKQWSETDATISNREKFKRYHAGRNQEFCFGCVKEELTVKLSGHQVSSYIRYNLNKQIYKQRDKTYRESTQKPSIQVMEIAGRKWAKLLWSRDSSDFLLS